MATGSSVLAWRIPGTGSLVGCRLWGCTELDTTKVTQQQQQLTCMSCAPALAKWLSHFSHVRLCVTP